MEQAKQNQESAAPQFVQEYVVRIPKDKHKYFNVMRFNHSLKVDVTKWKQVKMERENNYKEFKLDEDNPKFGAGSEFGRDHKEESRRKKHGIIVKQYNPEDQPWLLKVGGKGGKKFKGIREGGVTENASYYVFTQAADGTFESYPVEQWYNFTPIQCFKALSAEEAEEEFGRRDKVLNYFSIMVKKRLQTEAGDEEEDEEKKQGNKKKKKKKPQKDFKITDMDDWAHDLDDSGDSGNEEEEEEESSSKKVEKKGDKKKKKKKENKSDDEAVEESDEGDFDDKEVDYITSSSGSEEEIEEDEKANRDLKGVEDEEALRKLMSDEEEEEEEEEGKEAEETPEAKEKAAEQKTKQKQKKSDTSGESSSESSDSDFDDPKFTSAIFVPQNFQKSKKKSGSDNSAGSSRANTPTKFLGDKDGQKGQKRKYPDLSSSNSKKTKMENATGQSSGSSTLDGINEETIRRYLQRKPITASELLHKFKSKKTKMSSDQLVNKITDVLKKIPLQKTNIKGKMYLSLKT